MALLITEKQVDSENDSVLSEFLAAADLVLAERALNKLILEQIRPALNEIVPYKLRALAHQAEDLAEIADLQSEALSLLLARLNQLRMSKSDRPIRNFRNYVAVTAYHVCHDYLRRKYPHRANLKHKIRYVLNQRGEFGCWEIVAGEWRCGLAEWKKDPLQSTVSTSQAELQSRLGDLAASLPQGTAQEVELDELLATVFHLFGQPIELDQLVGIVAELQGIKDVTPLVENDGDDLRRRLEQLPDTRLGVADEMADRDFLLQLWQEIEQMTSRHCAALLLNLRDEQGGSALDLFLFTGAVSFAHIAESMEMTEIELASLWNQLPIDDLTIAARLGISRQQVINLRKSARQRLAKRLQKI